MPASPEGGLRERKKLRTRSAITHHALRLFRERGYEATTIAEIAEAAEISESTFYRYFPTKEAVLLVDDFDDELVAAFRAQPPELSLVEAMRRSLRETFEDITPSEVEDARERTALMIAIPEVRQALAVQLLSSIDLLAGLIGERSGRPAADPAVRAQAGAVIGALTGVALTPDLDLAEDFIEAMATALEGLRTAFTD